MGVSYDGGGRNLATKERLGNVFDAAHGDTSEVHLIVPYQPNRLNSWCAQLRVQQPTGGNPVQKGVTSHWKRVLGTQQ